MLHGFRNDGSTPVRMLNIHAPAGFDRASRLSRLPMLLVVVPAAVATELTRVAA